MRASPDATGLRAPGAQANGNGLAVQRGVHPGPQPLATAEQLRQRFAVEDERYAALREWMQSMLQEGVDYGRIPGCGPKPSLFKPGAEKVCQRFHFQPRFARDTEACEMFANRPDLVCLRCELVCRDTGEIVGEGRGAARLDERRGWTENNCLKIAEKRAQIDAVLRTVGLSEVFTQDVEDMRAATPSTREGSEQNGPPPAHNGANGSNGVCIRKPTDRRDSDRAKAWQRLRDCLLRFRAGGDERKAVRLQRSETDLRIVKRTARTLLAGFCDCPPDKAHLATTKQLVALCDLLDAAEGVDFENGTLIERGSQ